MKCSISLTGLILLACITQAQVTRTITINGSSVTVLAWNNRMQEHFSFPGMQAFIVVGDSSKSLQQIFSQDKLHAHPIQGMNEYACFYYLKEDDFLRNKPVIAFLEKLIEQLYDQDFIDRNRVHFIWQNNKPFSALLKTSAITDSLISSETIMDTAVAARHVWLITASRRTQKQYTIPGLSEMETKAEAETRIKQSEAYNQKKGSIIFQLSLGRHQIGQQYTTEPDTATMVDFSKLKTLWGIHIGYYFTHKLYGFLDVGLIYSGKQKKINSIEWGSGGGITVRGSGQAGAMIRYGIAIGWIPYHKERFSVLLNLSAGRLTAIAGGGTATRSIGGGAGGNATNIIQKKEQTRYINPSAGIQYRLSPLFYFTSQLQFMIASLQEPLGSVSAFTGWSANMGFGISFSAKKNKK